VVVDAGGNGIICKNLTVDTTDPRLDDVTDDSLECSVTNNVVIDPGRITGAVSECAVAQRNSGSLQLTPVTFENNTCHSPDGGGFERSTSITGTCTASDNILSDVPGTTVANCTGTNNQAADDLTFDFDNVAADDLEIGVDSTACNADPDSSPDEDYEGETRPDSSARDVGADESTACP
jgi:hypothetical protein